MACPVCGGEDRFHYTEKWFFCAHCSQGGRQHRGDAIELYQFLHRGATFPEAVDALCGNKPMGRATAPQRTPEPPPAPPAPPPAAQTAHWISAASVEIVTAHERLLSGRGGAGQHQDYLLGRGIEPGAWVAYQFGAGEAVSRDDGERKPCILLPWFHQGQPVGIRYRFIVPQRQRVSSRGGSLFSSRLWGGQVLPRVAEERRALVVCEGEINGASIWQAGQAINIDILSIGSEGQRIPDVIYRYLASYAQVIFWMDKEEVAAAAAAGVPGSLAFNSQRLNGRDANDLLKVGELQGLLAALRLSVCRDVTQREGVFWDIWDAGERGELDTHTTALLQVLQQGDEFSRLFGGKK